MSRLRLAAGSAILKLAQEPCYHDIITPEQFQLCGLVINVSVTHNPPQTQMHASQSAHVKKISLLTGRVLPGPSNLCSEVTHGPGEIAVALGVYGRVCSVR